MKQAVQQWMEKVLMASLLAVFLAAGCAGESTTGGDAAVEPDSGSAETMDGLVAEEGGLPPDAQPAGDLGVGTAKCHEILTCVTECSEQGCEMACVGEGTQLAQQQFDALLACSSEARTGTCQSPCQNAQSADCYACVDEACAQDMHVCLFGASELEGFGAGCTEESGCVEPLSCVAVLSGSASGFCTYPCEGDELCQGAPSGTYSQCVLGAGDGEKLCGFICKFGDTEYDCPPDMTCSDQELRAGSGVFLCSE